MNVSNQTMTRYLLGELPAEEQEAFEKAYFDDPRVFAEVSAAETTLIDDYVRGRLTPDVRRRFEQIYLTDPRRRERVAFAEVLVARAMPQPRRAPAAEPGPRNWPLPQQSSSRSPPGCSGSSRNGRHSARLPLRLVRPHPTHPSDPPHPPNLSSLSPTLALVLAPGVRSAEARAPVTLIIPAGAEEARLALTIQDAESQRFRVIVRVSAGPKSSAATFHRERRRPRRRSRSHCQRAASIPATTCSRCSAPPAEAELEDSASPLPGAQAALAAPTPPSQPPPAMSAGLRYVRGPSATTP